ncbi:hypothetical protein [Kibdelosporangium aridum]|uniref:hypothetical protein n=1 Tax=Kibdelosporangium aridum TaxID=2030 RepID=UPI0036D2B628
MQTATDLDHVLRAVTGPDLYRGNIFGVTGLPVDATAAQIRRRREEAILESRLNPDLDADAIRTAFETMRDPVARLAHELLWRWAPDEHREVVAAESQGPFKQEPRLDSLWKISLDAWADVFANPESWAFARERVKQIDDPRLTTGTVRRLRDRLPYHIAAVTAEFAVRAASLGVEAADRLVEVLDDSRLPDEAVDSALRDAVRPAERQISQTCETTKDVVQADESKAVAMADSLLAKAHAPLVVINALLGKDDELTVALSDQVALAVNNCAIADDRVTDNPAEAVRLLEQAQGYARLRATIDLINENLEVIRLSELTREMRADCDRGKVNRAARRRRALLRVLPDGEVKQALASIPPNDKRVGGDVKRAPLSISILGIGTKYYSQRRRDNRFQFTSTYWFTFAWIPLIAFSAYLTSEGRMHAKIPVGPVARWWRVVVLSYFLAAAVQDLIPGQVPWALVFLAFSLVVVGIRRLRMHFWALGKVNR